MQWMKTQFELLSRKSWKNCQPNLTVFAESTECHTITTSENIFRQLKVKSNFRNLKATVHPPAPSVEKISGNPYQWDSAWRWHEWIFVHFVTKSTVSDFQKNKDHPVRYKSKLFQLHDVIYVCQCRLGPSSHFYLFANPSFSPSSTLSCFWPLYKLELTIVIMITINLITIIISPKKM